MSKSVPELATRRPSTKRRHTCAKRTKITKLPIGVTIEEAIKQLFMIGVDGNAMESVTAFQPGFVYLRPEFFADRSATEIARVARNLKDLDCNPAIAAAHEGGHFQEAFQPPNFSLFPSARTVGNAVQFAERVGHAMGVEMASVGVDVCIGPCLDIEPQSKKKYFFGDLGRSFSRDASVVEVCALAISRGLRSAGIISCPVRFPGMGIESDDPLKNPTPNSHSRLEMDIEDLPPFRALLVEDQMEMVMLTNSVVSAIDPHNRSPFSNILVKMLRDDLSFWGLIITDDLSSPVIVNEKKPREIGVLALKAGMDVLLFQYNAMDMAQEAYEGVLQAVIDDTLPLQTVLDAYRRVTQAKHLIGEQKRQERIALLAGIGHLKLIEQVQKEQKAGSGEMCAEEVKAKARQDARRRNRRSEAEKRKRSSTTGSGAGGGGGQRGSFSGNAGNGGGGEVGGERRGALDVPSEAHSAECCIL